MNSILNPTTPTNVLLSGKGASSIGSIDTAADGTTVIVTTDNVRLVLTPEASVQLAQHFLDAMKINIKVTAKGVA